MILLLCTNWDEAVRDARKRSEADLKKTLLNNDDQDKDKDKDKTISEILNDAHDDDGYNEEKGHRRKDTAVSFVGAPAIKAADRRELLDAAEDHDYEPV